MIYYNLPYRVGEGTGSINDGLGLDIKLLPGDLVAHLGSSNLALNL